MTEDGNGVLSRWSRLKHQEKHRRDDGQKTASEVAQKPGEEADVLSSRDPDQSAIVEQLPDIETLEEGSDFTVFLKEGVPEALRRRALRKLWRLNPVFANLDGLNDYDEDFTIVTTLAANLKTLYQVGKGMPDAEAPENPEEDAGEPGEQSGTLEAESSTDEAELEPTLPVADGEDQGSATTESPTASTRVEPANDPVLAPTRCGTAKTEPSAARRRWAGFTS